MFNDISNMFSKETDYSLSYEAKTHPKLVKTIQEQLLDNLHGLPFYAEFNLGLNFYKKDSIKTCGVNTSATGFNFFYNEQFLDELEQKEVNFIDIHELFHLLFNHPQRTVLGNYDAYQANVVQDMIINYIIWSDIDHAHVEIPKYREQKDENGVIINSKYVGKNMTLMVPKEYEGPLLFEALYNWISEEKEKRKKNKSSCSNSENEYGPYGKDGIETFSLDHILDNMDKKNGCWLDSHLEDTIPQDLKDGMIDSLKEKCKNRGIKSSKVEKILDKLHKKRKDYLSEIKRSMNTHILGKNKFKTIVKPSRRGIVGIKGNKKYLSVINCILDTSGSMTGLIEKVLSYVFRNDIALNLILIDAEIQSVQLIRNMRELQKIKLSGYGGTQLNPAIKLVAEKYNQFATVILSDGFTDSLNFENIKGKVLIISADKKCPISKDNGKIKQIIVDKN